MSELAQPSDPESFESSEQTPLFGFWLYLMTDCVLFAGLFASFVVLRGGTAGGVNGADIFSLPFVFIETVLLLTSSFVAGLALLAARASRKRLSLALLGITGLLGLTFLGMELSEFHKLVVEGHSWTHSGFLSSYFTLIGTHGLHIFIGLIWLAATMLFIARRGFTPRLLNRLSMWVMFWHFLDIVWVGIFTIVYLTGVI